MRLPALCLCVLLLLPANATAAPPQLYNKTITTTATVSVSARADDGTMATYPRVVRRTLYISSKGRVFSRVERQSGRNQTTTERSPDETGKNIRFEGNRLIGVLTFPSGAAQMVINFDTGFSSCSTSVLFGREGGQGIRFKGLNGKMYTQQGPFNVSGQSCSIRDGNPFAN